MAAILQRLKEMPIPKNVPSLSHKMMALYGLSHLAHSMMPLVLFIPSYYADDLALPIVNVRMAIAMSRLLDVFTDPSWVS